MKKRKLLSLIMSVVMIIVSINFTMFTSYAYDVGSASALANLVSNVPASGAVTINFTADIDASGINYTSVSTSAKVTVNGNNHVIKNLRSSGNGLFAKVGNGSSIKNLGLVDAYVTNFNASGSGYGLLCGDMGANSTVTECFAHGSMAIYGSARDIGGLVGKFNGTMNNCFTVTDVLTDGSYVGGLIGYYYSDSANTAENTVSISYSTGEIDNEGRNYIGGLVGYSDISCLHQCYTTAFIKNPYADTVKSIGNVPDLDESVFYDEYISFQRQGDLDGNHRFNTYYSRFPSSDLWVYNNTYYPQIAFFYNNPDNPIFKNISAISSALVHINDGYGREHVPLSTESAYNFATITSDTGTGNNKIEWKITGGVDEYYYSDTNTSAAPGKVNGLSGNAYDVNSGKYLFTTETDVVFTASSGGYERDITLHVSSDSNPYIPTGAGTSASPFIITNAYELDMVRMYCVDDLTGDYYYRVETPKSNNSFTALDLSSYPSWTPIVGFKGEFNGNYTSANANKYLLITNLNIDSANENSAGLFATVTGPAAIKNVFIKDAEINTDAENTGILAGTVKNASLTNCTVYGEVTGSTNTGTLIGKASGTSLSQCVTFGYLSADKNCGGIIGYAETSDVSVTDCYSTTVLTDALYCGGIYGYSEGAAINTSLYTGNIAPDKEGERYGLSGGNAVITNSYYDRQAAGISSGDAYGWTTAGLVSTTDYPQLGTNWMYSTNSYFPYLSSCETQLRWLIFNPVTYTPYTASEEANFTNFQSANFANGYSLSASSVDGFGNYTISGNKFTNVFGGRERFKLKKEGTGYSYERYILFDVKDLNVYYKVTVSGADNEYVADMSDKTLTDFIADSTSKYSLILGTTDSADYTETPIKISQVEESLGVSAVMPAAKYTYTVNAYADKDQTEILESVDDSTYTFGMIPSAATGRYTMYIDIVITQKDILPWGIYNIDCN